MLSINVLVVTYNQEKVIGRALESVLQQKDYGLNKIIICDDCSKDNNRAVLKKYEASYPDIIENHFNEVNQGIYGNCNKLVSVRGDADLYVILSGDDALKDGWFRCIQDFARSSNIISGDEPFTFYSDWSSISSNGAENFVSNGLVAKYPHEALSLKIRGLICDRSTIHSKGTMDQFSPVELSKGLSYAEELYDTQAPRFSINNYYIPFNASIYYTGIGVSTHLGREYLLEDEGKWNMLISDLNLEGKDLLFARYKQERAKFYRTHKFRHFCRTLYLYISSSKLKYGGTLKGFLILLKSMMADFIRSKNQKL